MEFIALLVSLSYVGVGATFWIVGTWVRRSVIVSRRRELAGKNTIIAEYTAPPDIRPGELAYLYDQAVGVEEFLSTVFDLERRGYLTLNKGSRAGLIHASATGKKPDDLLVYEHDAYGTALSAEINMKSYGSWLDRFWGNRFEYLLEKRLQQNDLLEYVPETSRSLFTPFMWKLAVIATVWAFFTTLYGSPSIILRSVSDSSALTVDTFDELSQFLRGIFAVFIAFGITLVAAPFLRYGWRAFKKARRLATMTDRLERMWPALEGYREYVTLVELDRIRFANEVGKEHARNETLPYAVALNLSTNWKKRFE